MIPHISSPVEFFNRFPSLKLAAEDFPVSDQAFINVNQFLAWTESARLSQSQKQAAYLVASAINHFRPLPDGKIFDFATAITCWDADHWAAFRDWTSESLK